MVSKRRPVSFYEAEADLGVIVKRYGYHDDTLWVSEEHPRINGVFREGGPFFMTSENLRLSPKLQLYWKKNGVRIAAAPYVGRMYNAPPTYPSDETFKNRWLSEQLALIPLGTKGFKATRPAQSIGSLANFAYELRDLPQIPFRNMGPLSTLPQRLFTELDTFRKLGGQYLNVVFGWKPFVRDVQKMYETYQKLDKELAQIEKDNGKGIRRRRKIQSTTTTSVIQNTRGFIPFLGWENPPPFWCDGFSTVDGTETTSVETWFVGKYRYYIPDVGTSQWKRSMTRKLYGATITPEVLYNALPWSWLMDWFVNVGDVMSNLSSNVDNLTADYAYVMRTTKVEQTWNGYTRWVGGTSNVGTSLETIIPPGEASRTCTYTKVTKSRIAASPYGFGLVEGNFTVAQQAILAALALSRGVKR